MSDLEASARLTEREAAARLGVSEHTLRAWRVAGRGPAYYRIGAGPRPRVRYTAADLDAWVASRRVG
jgi:hypothetical protein